MNTNKWCRVSSSAFRQVRSGERGAGAWVIIGVLATACTVVSAVIWTMHLTADSTAVPEYSKAVKATEASQEPSGRDALARMFVTPAAASVAGAREIEGIQLQGIVGYRRGAGVALFSIDGAPPVRVRAGGSVRDGVKLVEVKPREVLLERSGTLVALALAKRATLQDMSTNAPQHNKK